MANFCGHCGARSAGGRYCTACGQPFSASEPPSVTPPSEPIAEPSGPPQPPITAVPRHPERAPVPAPDRAAEPPEATAAPPVIPPEEPPGPRFVASDVHTDKTVVRDATAPRPGAPTPPASDAIAEQAPTLPPESLPTPPPTPNPAVSAVAASWPIPERTVTVAGRRLTAEVVVVAAVHALAAAWLLWAIRDLVSILPDILTGLFSDELSFFFFWLIFIAMAMILYVVGLLAYCAFLLLRGDPVGRGVAATICATLTLLLFTSARTSSLVLIWLVSGVCVAVLFLSPWVRRAFDRLSDARVRPPSVVLSQTLSLSYLSLLGAVAVAMLPGLRFASDIGGRYLAFELLDIATVVVGLIAVRRLSAGPDPTARVLLSIALAAPILAMIASQSGAGIAIGLAMLGGAVAPLWFAPDARAWFSPA